MRKSHRMDRATGGEISRGKADAVIPGNRHKNPSETLSVGGAQAVRKGESSKSLALGRSTGGHGPFHEKFAKGGYAKDMGFEKKGERLKIARKRNEVLGEPAFKRGGKIHIQQALTDLYKKLHGRLEKEPYMKKLGVTSADVYEGEPHRASKRVIRKATSGRRTTKF